MRSRILIAVHDGNVHPDESFAIAALMRRGLNIEVIRTRDPRVLARADWRVDVGGKNNPETRDYDHHQPEGAGCRENGIPYASFGLIWKQFGTEICGGNEDVARDVEYSLVSQVDAEDSGYALYDKKVERVIPFTLSPLFKDLLPIWSDENRNMDKALERAVALAGEILDRRISRAKAKSKASEIVLESMKTAVDSRIIVLPAECPWEGLVMNRSCSALYVVYPAANGAWRVKCVPKGVKNFFEMRKPLPEMWAGKNDADLANVTGVPDAFFCHRKRFTAGARSREGALRLAQLAADA